MSLPLLKRATEDGVTFVLTPATYRDPTPAALQPAPRLPLRAPGPGEQYRFHVDMGKCIGCKCCVVACNEQNGNPAAINWRRVTEIEGGWYAAERRIFRSVAIIVSS
jgi:ferredoxin